MVVTSGCRFFIVELARKAKTELILPRRRRKVGKWAMLIYRKISLALQISLRPVCIENTSENELCCVHCSNVNIL